jgi:hypothetical protein
MATVNELKEMRPVRFQADLSPGEAAILDSLKAELDFRSNAELLTEALSILAWVVRERRLDRAIVSLDERNNIRELVSAYVERAIRQYDLPRVNLDWTPEQVLAVTRLATQEPADPSDRLITAMKRRR